jgi:hypothetical protein
MPAKSKSQQQLMAIAEHNPSAVKSENAGILEMSHEQLHDFAATKTEGLPQRVKKKRVTTKVKMSGPKAPPDQLKQIRNIL